MKKGKLLTLLPLLLAVGLSACNDNQSNGKLRVGICQLLAHPALDKATEGFIKAVEDGLGKDKVEIDKQVASGDTSTCLVIANKFVSQKADLIMANATPALQTVAHATTNIPI